MTALKISLLGSFQVTQGNKPVTAFKSNKDRALLAYLAVEAKQVHSRDKLATLLWADMADRDARNNLRYTLSSLRRTIGDREANPAFLLISRDDIQWNHASQPQIDTTQWAEFTTAVSPNNPDISQLQQAVTLHRSSFLDGFALSDSLPFDEWLMLKREQYHRELIAVLSTLANCFEQNGRYAQALTYAQQLIRLEPWQEETQRQIMRLLAYQGRRSEALAQYEMCCLALQTELRIAPEATTSWLYEQIRDGALQIPQPPPLFMQDDVEHAPAPIFVARQQELDQLHDTLNQVLAGHGQLSFVVGEAGTGKTSLLKEFAVQAQRQHPQLLVAGGHGIAYTGKGNPFAPIYQLFDMLTGDVEARWSVGDVSGEQARRLWHMLPHTTTALVKYGPDLIGSFVNGNSLLRRALAHPGCDLNTLQQLTTLLNTQATMPPGTAVKRQHLFEQVRRVLMELARELPLLITLDDLQWADDASIILLAHLTPLLAGQHIFIIGSYRPEEVTMEQEPNRHPLAPFINQCQRQWGDVTISLDKEHDQEFLKALLDTNPNHLSANFRSTLLKRTQGHPLFTVELLDGMKTKGDIFQDNAGFWTESPTLNWNGLPARVDAAIGERIARLPANLRTALAIAAVEGETFTVEVITSIQNDDTLLSEFSGSLAQEHRLIRAVDLTYVAENPLSRYQFRHNLFQHYLYTNLDTVQRTQYHAAIGQSLATLYQTDPTAIKKAASHLAWHFDKAGLPAQAVTYYQQAAHHARQLSAYGEVIAHCQRALALLDTLPENRERIDQKIDFLINMGNSAAATHGYGSPLAGQARRKALTLCRQLDNTPQLLPALWSMVAHYYATAEHQTARELCQQLIAITEQLGDPVQKALAHWMLGLVLFHQGEFAAAHEALTFPVEFLNPEEHHYLAHVTDQDPTVSSLVWMGLTLWFLGYPDQAEDHCRRAISFAEQLNHPLSLAFAVGVGGDIFHSFRREYEVARIYSQQNHDVVEQEGFAQIGKAGLVNQGIQASEAGEHAKGIALIQEGIAGWQATGAKHMCSQYQADLAHAYWLAQKPELGLTTVAEALVFVAETGERYVEAELYRLQGDLYKLQAKESFAEASYQQAIAIAREQQAKIWELRATTSLCQLWQQQGKLDQARHQLDAIYNWFSEGFATPDLEAAKNLLEEIGGE